MTNLAEQVRKGQESIGCFHELIKRVDADRTRMVSHEHADPSTRTALLVMEQKVDGTGGGWGPPRSDYLRSDALLRDLNEQQIDKP